MLDPFKGARNDLLETRSGTAVRKEVVELQPEIALEIARAQ
jgi:hypothetical protein